MLSKSDILSNKVALPFVDVECMGGVVRVRAMSAGTRDIFEQRMGNLEELEKGVSKNLRATFLIHCIVDESNELMFTIDDVDALSSKSSVELDKLFDAAQRINGLQDTEAETKKK